MVRYALLALLNEQRDYGYRLKRRFDDRVGAIWHLNIGQVYQTLRTLERAGMIAAIDGLDGAGATHEPYPARRLYELTTRGRRVLEQWLQRPPIRPRPFRDETLIRLLVFEPRRTAEALARISAQENLYRRHLSRLTAQKRRSSTKGNGAAAAISRLGLEAAVLHTEAHIKWLTYCRQWLDAYEDRKVETTGSSSNASGGTSLSK